MSSRVKLWATRGALALPIVASVGLSLWFTRPVTAPSRQAAFAAEPDGDAEPAVRTDAVGSADDGKSVEERAALMRSRRIQLLATQPSSAANETEAAEALLELYAPHMWKRLQHMPADGPVRTKLQRQMLERARDLQRMQQRDPEQFKNEVEQVKLEDDVADLGRQIMRRGEPSSTDQETLKKTLRETVEKLVDVRLRNRQARLDRLAKTLESEKNKLEADRDNRDKLVQRQFDTVVNSRRPFVGPGGPGEGRPTLSAPNGPRRGAGTSRPGNESKAEVQASPARSPQTDSASDDKSK
jgi:hypothetical protein